MKSIEFTKKEGNEIVKYKLTFSTAELNNIRNTIKEKSTITEHRSYDTTFFPIKKNSYLNYHTSIVSSFEDRNYLDEHYVYHVEYDEIIYSSKLVELIDRLVLYGDSELLYYLDGSEELNDLNTITLLLSQKHDELINFVNERKYDEAKTCLDDILLLEKRRELYSQENDYLQIIKSLLTFEKIDSIDCDIYERAMTFSKMHKSNK